jgi:hypothetical protein
MPFNFAENNVNGSGSLKVFTWSGTSQDLLDDPIPGRFLNSSNQSFVAYCVDGTFQFTVNDDATELSLIDIKPVQQAEIVTMLNTRAAFGNTVAASGVLGPVSLTGTGNEQLPPPATAQPPTGGSYNGFVKVAAFQQIAAGGELSVVGGEFVVGAGGAGDYRTPHAWLDISTSANNNVLGFIFGIEKFGTGLVSFSQRVTGEKGAAQNLPTNISGGGFVEGLEPGDKISLWAACSVTADLTIYDGNIGLEMSCPASLKS